MNQDIGNTRRMYHDAEDYNLLMEILSFRREYQKAKKRIAG